MPLPGLRHVVPVPTGGPAGGGAAGGGAAGFPAAPGGVTGGVAMLPACAIGPGARPGVGLAGVPAAPAAVGMPVPRPASALPVDPLLAPMPAVTAPVVPAPTPTTVRSPLPGLCESSEHAKAQTTREPIAAERIDPRTREPARRFSRKLRSVSSLRLVHSLVRDISPPPHCRLSQSTETARRSPFREATCSPGCATRAQDPLTGDCKYMRRTGDSSQVPTKI
jgi:hypothetical protein